ncbi:kinase-like domain-containing protein [Cokeromyces recurvatus]|uniref:kinase-like domain-containing protein n=1 Tax=Cokeromyces recurvatus TaxID=90255 RepID=UPI00221E3BE5|nr:kinase-like domain-containing protein [Cokeromyces recurvatus]KAI7900986.1 kinase-like domain-containing protein [Cokeromyces recurvatus]
MYNIRSYYNHQQEQPRAGILCIRLCEAKGITLPQGAVVPTRTTVPINENNHKKQVYWWLPYVVLEFDKNEVFIDAVGGDTSCPVYNYKANFDVSCYSNVFISIYLRQPYPSQHDAVKKAHHNDYFLGRITLQPNFNNPQVILNQVYSIIGGTGAMWIQSCYYYYPHHQTPPLTPLPQQQQQQQPTSSNIHIQSFDLLRVIGRGSFGKVYAVRKKDTNRIYAMKVLKKSRIISRSEVTHTMAEKTVLARVKNPFIVPLKFAFQSPDKLYLVLAFINGGELFRHLQEQGKFNEEKARFYTAELLCALECLHDFNVIYRDLKPENILLDYNGHIALCDFGLCKLNMTDSKRTNTFCGTPEYLAPELLLGQGYTKTVDWWTLGILLYEMLTGLPPFYDENTNEMYRKILQEPLRFPDDMSESAQDLLIKLLARDPNRRLGNRGTDEIRNHSFFRSIDWVKLMRKEIQPPFKPTVKSAYDTTNFDEEFTSEQPVESVTTEEDSHISKTMQEQFKGFTYDPNEGAGISLNNSYNYSSDNHSFINHSSWIQQLQPITVSTNANSNYSACYYQQ